MPAGHVNAAVLHPLSEYATGQLRRIRDARPHLRPHEVDPRVMNQLFRENLISYCSRMGARWIEITYAGERRLAEEQ